MYHQVPMCQEVRRHTYILIGPSSKGRYWEGMTDCSWERTYLDEVMIEIGDHGEEGGLGLVYRQFNTECTYMSMNVYM